jgi:hypothetical protein
VIPAGVELLSFDAALFSGLFFEHVQGKSSQCGEVFGGVTSASTALVFMKADIRDLADP